MVLGSSGSGADRCVCGKNAGHAGWITCVYAPNSQPTIDVLPGSEYADDPLSQSLLAAWISEAKRDAKTLSSDDMADVIVACMKRERWRLRRTTT
jgi:hypothetical protein